MTTGYFSGWGTRYFEFVNKGFSRFGAVVGLTDEKRGDTEPHPDYVIFRQFEDGTLVREFEVEPHVLRFMELEISPSANKVRFEMIGFDEKGQMHSHGGLVIGTPRAW